MALLHKRQLRHMSHMPIPHVDQYRLLVEMVEDKEQFVCGEVCGALTIWCWQTDS